METETEKTIRMLIRLHPSYPKLVKATRSFFQSLESPEETKNQITRYDAEPEKFFRVHATVLNAKSARAQKLKILAEEILRDTGLPRLEGTRYRGENYLLDWKKLEAGLEKPK